MGNVIWSVMASSIHRFLIKAERIEVFQLGFVQLSLRASCLNRHCNYGK
jgi:hypothetical protein